MDRKKTLALWVAALFLCFVNPVFANATDNKALVRNNPVPVNSNTKKVTGKVVDEKGESLPGVTITIKGRTRGVTTDIDGSFSIDVLPTDVLIVSYIGMDTQNVPVGNKKSLNITLKEKGNELEGVTVVAFAKQKKEDVLASITTVRPSELKVPSSNLTTALAGRIAGLISYQRSGEPGSDDASFFVRGVTSLTYASGPLILIDGVEMSSSDLARLQTDDIASFSIMKDAAATALYGARGANGVILVTTKEGVEGPATISVRYECSLSEPTKDVELADPITYMKMNNEAVYTRDKTADLPYSQEKIDNTVLGSKSMIYPANDWKNMLLKNSIMNHRVNFNLSGGGKVARYYVAGSFTQDNGLLKVDKRNNFNNNIDLKRYLLRSNVNINVTKTTQIEVRLHGSFSDYSGPLYSGSTMYQRIMQSDPVLFPAYYEADDAHQYTNHILFGNYDKGQYLNPYAMLVSGYKNYSESTILAQFEFKQNLDFITKGLNLRGLFSTSRYSYFDVSRQYNPYYYAINNYDKHTGKYTLSELNTDGTEYLGYKEGDNNIYTVTYGEVVGNYDRKFGKNGVSGLLAFTVRNKLTGNAGSLSASLPARNIGFAGRFTYNYDERYFTEFNFGYNGSERFAPSERWGFFPSFGVGYIISKEKFFKPLTKVFNMLKLKATYGLVGNDAIGESEHRFFYLSEISANSSAYQYTWGNEFGHTVNGVAIKKYPNSKITWERSYKTNLGIEARMFDMFDLQVDYYTETRKNILLTRSYIPSTMGLQATPMSNLGEAFGRGVDASLEFQKSFNKDFWITGRANFTFAKTKYTKYEEIDYSATPWLSKIGRPVSQVWGYVAERLFVDDEEVKNSPKQFGDYGAGDIKYKDVNGDGVITELDKVPIGYPTEPEIIYGFGFSAGYKKVDLSCFFQGAARESFWISPSSTAPFVDTDGNGSLVSKNALLKVYADDHWSEDNRNLYALWPRLSTYAISNNNQVSTWFMRDGTFIRLKSVEAGFTFPTKWLQKLYVKNFRVYISGTNLLTFSKFKLWDPELAGNGFNYPTQRVFNLGVQVKF